MGAKNGGKRPFIPPPAVISSDWLIQNTVNEIVGSDVLAQRARFGKAPCIVDLATGSGYLPLFLASQMPGAKVIATDRSLKDFGVYINGNPIEYQGPVTKIEHCLPDDLPFAPNSVSCLTILRALGSLNNTEVLDTFKQLQEIIQNAGLIYVAVSHHTTQNVLIRESSLLERDLLRSETIDLGIPNAPERYLRGEDVIPTFLSIADFALEQTWDVIPTREWSLRFRYPPGIPLWRIYRGVKTA